MTPRRPTWPLTIGRTLWALVFTAGSVTHVVLGGSPTSSAGYAAFGHTTLLPGLARLWEQVVMPDIRAYTLGMAVVEALVAVLICLPGRSCRIGAIAAVAFFAS